MPEELNSFSDEEKLKAENEFLKMKLMLEQGAHFDETDIQFEISPQVENEFLNYIAAFERQSQNPKYITVFDKIGRPSHFKKVSEITDSEIDKAWHELSAYLQQHNIGLDVCSPNISVRELYRFTTEELFLHEMNDMNIPGLNTNFIYDEFYPDPVYDNSIMVEQDLFRDIFRKEDLFCENHYDDRGFFFNDKLYEDWKVFADMINRFKSLFDEIHLAEFVVASCEVKGTGCAVQGNYKAEAKTGEERVSFNGNFRVDLIVDDLSYWDFKTIEIENFNPA